jgi:hypothetical protein
LDASDSRLDKTEWLAKHMASKPVSCSIHSKVSYSQRLVIDFRTVLVKINPLQTWTTEKTTIGLTEGVIQPLGAGHPLQDE